MKPAHALLLIAGLLVASACGGGDGLTPGRVFSEPSWNVPEQLEYRIRERDDVRGTCLLQTEDAPGAGHVYLVSLCASPDGRYRDERRVEVEESTLTPVYSERTYSERAPDLEERNALTITATYGDETVVRRAHDGETESETTRELPRPTEKNPDPGYYDDFSLFWLVRGVALAEGYDAAFADFNPWSARIVDVRLTVTGSETVTVPAGEFETWKVELKTGSITQIMWVEKTETRRVVLARIEREFHELLPAEGP